MRIKNIIYTISFLSSLIAFSQNNSFNDSYQKFQKAFPKMPLAPTSYSFIRQGDIPVSEYTGALNFNLNLYTIEEGDITLPITLNYVGGNGIKINEEANWVGLGWNLTLPTITQIINDYDDLTRSNFIRPDYFKSYTPLPQFQQIINTSTDLYYAETTLSRPVIQPELQNGIEISQNFLSFYNGASQRKEDIKNYTFDSEPDYFIANLLGENVKFISKIDPYNGSLIFEALNKSAYKIQKISNDNFIITDNKGTKYYFEEKEEISNYVYGMSGSLSNRNWYVTKIESTDNDAVIFTYQNINSLSTLPQISQSSNKTNYSSVKINNNQTTLDNEICKSINYQGDPNYHNSFDLDNFSSGTGNTILNSSYTKQDYTNYKVINEILFSSGKIKFFTSDRIDNSFKKLDKIVIENKEQVLVKEVNFNFEYFDSNTTNSLANTYNFNIYGVNIPLDYYTKRLKLVAVNNFEEKPYQFEYNNVLLPQKNSFARDYWGYYNGKHSNKSLIPNPIHFQGYEDMGDNQNNLNPDVNFCKAGLIEKITYPSGGKSIFDFELNSGTNYYYDSLNMNNTIQYGNGLRLKSVTNVDNNNQVGKTRYEYTNGKSLIPLSFFKNINSTKGSYTFNSHPTCAPSGAIDWCTGMAVSYSYKSVRSNNSVSLDGFNFSNVVGYDSVDKITEDLNNITNGKISILFYNNPLTLFNVTNNYLSLPPLIEPVNENGNVLSKTYTDKNNQVVRKEEYTYNFYLSDIDYGVKIQNLGLKGLMDGIGGGGYCGCYHPEIFFIDVSLYGCYPIYSFETNLSQKKEINYSGSDALETITNLAYNNKRLLTSESSQNSDQTVLSKQNFYSFERLSNPHMAELVNTINNYSEIVESNIYRNGTMLYNFKNNYSKDPSTSNLIKTKEVLSKKGQNNFERKAIYDKYDTNGNITQYTLENGMTTSIIWGYNKTLPIAKIENASLSQISVALGISINDLNNLNETNLNTLNTLRTNNNLSGAMITTYSHIPLIGVQTITDVRGNTVHYTYDSFNRLKNIKDKDLNILNEYKYHFKN